MNPNSLGFEGQGFFTLNPTLACVEKNTRATQSGGFSRGALGFKHHHSSLPAQIHLPNALAPGNVDHAAVPEFRKTKKGLASLASRLMHGSRTHLTNADIPLPKSIQVHKHQETKRQAKTHAHTHTHMHACIAYFLALCVSAFLSLLSYEKP